MFLVLCGVVWRCVAPSDRVMHVVMMVLRCLYCAGNGDASGGVVHDMS